MPGRADLPFAIGADPDRWPGLAKLAEECGELQQVIGKLMAFPDGGEHPDGAGRLDHRLADELADVLAAVLYVRAHTVPLVPLQAEIERRQRTKFELFQRWDWEARGGQ